MPRLPSDDAASSAQSAFLDELSRVAGSSVTVLLRGEAGVGKSRAARALHQASSRSAGPLVVVDLGALAPSLMEAELFGHEEGAFTGAHRARLGRVRSAEGGTLVLEGIEGLAPQVQGKLLRVLQERVVEPLGSELSVPVDVRVVATCGPDLDTAVEQGDFREDLYFRLAVVIMDVPPLRARAEDLPDLVQQILADVADRAGVECRDLTPEALERLASHPWPGNVRELENALERALVLGSEGTGPLEAEAFAFLGEAIHGAELRLAREILAAGLTLDQVGRAVLEAALDQSRGNYSAAARALQLSRRAFEYRLDKLRGDSADGADQGGAAGDSGGDS